MSERAQKRIEDLLEESRRLRNEISRLAEEKRELERKFSQQCGKNNELQEKLKGALHGKVALVTGASRGIGRATAIALAAAGADVAINYQRSSAAAEEVASVARTYGVKATAYQADVSKEGDVTRMVESVRKDLGHVDILVNNAGITHDKSFLKMTKTMWDEVMGVNLTAPFTLIKALLPKMAEHGWGRIINIASIVGQTGNFGQANFAASKGGLIALTMSLAREISRKGITANIVSPGFIDTDMIRDLPKVVLDGVKAMTPISRLGKPEEVASAIVYLATPQASFITGQVIAVNGGLYM